MDELNQHIYINWTNKIIYCATGKQRATNSERQEVVHEVVEFLETAVEFGLEPVEKNTRYKGQVCYVVPHTSNTQNSPPRKLSFS